MIKAAQDGVIIVFGLSAVGKTRMTTAISAQNDFRHLSASALLADARKKIDAKLSSPEDLRKGAVLDNQSVLLEAFGEVRRSEKRVIIVDAHNIIDNDAKIIEVPQSIVAGFKPDIIIFVFDDPKEIQHRRDIDKLRVRPKRSVTDLEVQQERAIEVAQKHASNIGIDCVLVRSGDEVAFQATVEALYQRKSNLRADFRS